MFNQTPGEKQKIRKLVTAVSLSLVFCVFPAFVLGLENTDPDTPDADFAPLSEEAAPTDGIEPTDGQPADAPGEGAPAESADDPGILPAQTENATQPKPETIVVENGKKVMWANHTFKMTKLNNSSTRMTSWTTSNKKIVSVSKKGKVTARRLGTAIVKGYDKNGNLRKKLKITVKLGRDYTLFVAHRGYCVSAPENTLPAFKAAVNAGFPAIELDVWESKTTPKSKTPFIIVMHDKNLKKKTGKSLKTNKLNRSNRKKYKIRKNVNGIKKYGPQTIPTLNEALKCIYGKAKAKKVKAPLVEIDIKGNMSDRAVKYIIKQVGSHRVHIMSNSRSTLKRFKKYRKYKQTEIWYWTETKKSSARRGEIKKAGKAGFDGISIPFKYMNKKTIKLAKSYGMEIGGWDISKASEVQKWVIAGCTRFNMYDKVFR